MILAAISFYYLDGKEVYKSTTQPSDLSPMYAYFDLIVGGFWPVDLSFGVLNPGGASSLYYEIAIAYLRVWDDPTKQ
jgi:hypothetical protein